VKFTGDTFYARIEYDKAPATGVDVFQFNAKAVGDFVIAPTWFNLRNSARSARSVSRMATKTAQ
jgi:hypothetical protein